jgi:leader peptidase (prepilin peptidase)/N-methyltransferase
MTSEIGVLLFLVIIGWASGMLVNYLADVLPWKRRLVRPFCPSCDTAQSPINYLLYPRRCVTCKSRRGWRTWIIEFIYIGLAIWTWACPANKINFWLGWMILIYFGVVIVIDIEHRLIMHPVSLAGAVLGLVIGLIRNSWWETLLGGAVGFALMWLLYRLGDLIMKGLARMRGQTLDDVALGFGDVNLSGVLGLMLGWPLILPGLLLSIFIGGGVSLIYLVLMIITKRYRLFMALPYGPFLIAGAFLLLFFGEHLLKSLGY